MDDKELQLANEQVVLLLGPILSNWQGGMGVQHGGREGAGRPPTPLVELDRNGGQPLVTYEGIHSCIPSSISDSY